MATVEVNTLQEKLAKFYCEARPQKGSKEEVYHKNTLKNIRSALNRYLQDIGRNIDIVKDAAFKPANRTLDGMLKCMTREGISRPTKHKQVIATTDLEKIHSYLANVPSNPIILRQCVWFQLAIHFVSRGLEFYHHLNKQSFSFQEDENGREYVTLTHETQQKNFQGGLHSEEAASDKRMYANGTSNCPVEMLRLLIKKTAPKATALFNVCYSDAIRVPSSFGWWYDDKPLKARTFTNFMADICKASKCSTIYTAHCLRATAITAMNDAGFEARHIMFMSGHRNEGSIRSYNRSVSSNQKLKISNALSTLSTSKSNEAEETPVENPLQPETTPPSSNCQAPAKVSNSLNVDKKVLSMNQLLASSGVLSDSSFQNCSFNLNFQFN